MQGTMSVAARAFAAALLAAGLAAPLPAAAEEERYAIDPAHTFPSFEVRHLGVSIQRGRFNRTRGTITLDREARTGTVQISIDPDSVDTGGAQLEAVLRSDQYFDTEQFPVAEFRARHIEFDGDRPARIPGELTLRGVTRPLTLVVTSFACAVQPIFRRPVCGADATATVRRSEFGMTRHLGLVGDEVRLLIQVEAVRE